MHYRVAVGMKIQPLLANRGSCQHEGPERRVEGLAYLVGAEHYATIVRLLVTETHGKTSADTLVLNLHAFTSC